MMLGEWMEVYEERTTKSHKQGIHSEFDRDVIGMGVFNQGGCCDERQVTALPCSCLAAEGFQALLKSHTFQPKLAVFMSFGGKWFEF